MSEVKLNLVDADAILSGTIHGSDADRCIAALSAEPETINELTHAMGRYIKLKDDENPFAFFTSQTEVDDEPWDAGIVTIDLAARVVAIESSYSHPDTEGEVLYHDGTSATEVSIPYRLPDDWFFVNSVDAYHWSSERRRQERRARVPLDARAILYGPALIRFIAEDAIARRERAIPIPKDLDEEKLQEMIITRVHANWLMREREDLDGKSPRDVLLEKQDFIDHDLHLRSLQWSFLNEGPPCFSPDSFAYRYAGFGTHEWVVYYDLVRYLLWQAADLVGQASVGQASPGQTFPPVSSVNSECLTGQDGPLAPALHLSDFVGARAARPQSSIAARNAVHRGSIPTVREGTITQDFISTLAAKLDQLKTAWLESPAKEYDGRIPAIIIDNERRRLPQALSASELIIDEDCDFCRMQALEVEMGHGPGFWHLDGSHMEDEFAFSTYATPEEWAAENARMEEFNRAFDRKMAEERAERLARGEIDLDIFDPDPPF